MTDLATQQAGAIQKVPLAVSHDTGERYKQVAVTPQGQVRESARIDMGGNQGQSNNIIQFDIVNAGAGAVDELVRIGSLLGAPDSYKRFGTTVSGVDSAKGISDNFGVNLQMCQGFSEMSCHKPVFIRTIKLISADTTQLNSKFTHKYVTPDFTIIPLNQNVAFTREKSDQATDLLIAKGSWLLSATNFLEFTSKATKSLSIVLELSSIADVRQFVQYKTQD